MVIVFVFLFLVALIARLFDIQIIKSDELKYFAKRQQVIKEKIDAERGLIYDRNNVLLVYNRNDVSFYVDLRMASAKDKRKIADKFSSVFGKSRNYYLRLMKSGSRTICLEKKAPGEKAFMLNNFRANGLFHRDDPTRVYYYKDLASHVLGYVGSDFHGVNGIAKSLDEQLAGEDGSRVVLRDAIGDMITVAEEQTKPAVPGLNVVLTINKTYQAILENELKEGVKKYEATSAVGIIMDPNNGQILALANSDDYDPNQYWKYSNDNRRDKAVTDTYEPGSTFKTFTMSALLDKHLCNENEKVYVNNGKYRFKNVNITDTHKNQWLTVRGVIEESSNVGMSKLVQKLDDDTFYKYLRAFGFGNYTAIDLPGEVKGTLKKPNEWSQVTKAFMSFGYGVTVTPIQLAAAYCAVVNGGILYQPEIVLKEFKMNGDVVFRQSPVKVRRVISEKTSERMKKLLVDVVKKGTGVNAQIKNVTVGGKTGTSQKLIEGKYSKMDYNSSFVGFFPADDPQIVCLILVNSPEIGRYGGSVAAPMFKDIAEQIINTDINLFRNKPEQKQDKSENIKIMPTTKITQNGRTNLPGKSSSVKTVNLYPVNKNIMPDLSEYSLRDAITVLSNLGIKYKVYGAGKIVAQSIKPGRPIVKGNTCVLTCKEQEVAGTSVY